MKRIGGVVVGIVAACVGLLIATSPKGVTPPVIPEGSEVAGLPPWPAFRMGTALNGFFKWLADTTTPPDIRALALGSGYWESTITYGLAKNGLLDDLPSTCEAAASAKGLNAEFSCRFLRAGEALGLVSANKNDGVFKRTAVGDALMNEMHDFVMMINEETREAWWASATVSLRTGESGFKEKYGEEFWSWHAKKGNERQSAQFDAAMKSLSASAVTAMLGEYALAGNEVLCDVGGGRGHLVSSFNDHWPNTTAIVFDLPGAASQALPNVRGISGSFLKRIPDDLSQCDVFFLKSVLHDWGDQDSVTILANIKKVAKKTNAKLVVFEMVLGEGPSIFKRAHHLLDINMLASNPKGAKERSFDEFTALNAAAGIDSATNLIPARGPFCIMETPLFSSSSP